MENQETSEPIREVPNQTPTQQLDKTEKGSFLSSKWLRIGIAVIVIILVLSFTFVLGKNSSNPKISETNQTSTVKSSPTPTPDPTADWKTYTNTDLGFSFKYPAGWTINDQSYTTGGQEYIGFAIQGPLRKDIPESNGKSAYYIKVLKYDSKTNALIANTAYGPSGEQFIFQKEANDQAVTEVPVSIDFIENSAEYKTANQILATYIIDEGSSCGPNAGQAGDTKCPSGFTCKNINSSGIGSCTKN